MSQQLSGERGTEGGWCWQSGAVQCGPTGKCAMFGNRELVSYLSQGWCGEAVRSRNQMAVGEVGREAKGTGAGPVNYTFLKVWLRQYADQVRPRKDKVIDPQHLAFPLRARKI